MSKIGFFGGSFNPPTNAHIGFAKQIVKECNLDKLIFVPIGDFYNKQDLVEFKHRYNMLKTICHSHKNLEVSNIEENNQIKTYAIDIFKIMEEKYKNDNLYFIMGSDNLKNITTWNRYNELVKNYKYIILERQKNDFNQIIEKNTDIKNNLANFKVVLNENYINISSSVVREKIKNNKDVSKLIPIEIEEYIRKNKLYM